MRTAARSRAGRTAVLIFSRSSFSLAHHRSNGEFALRPVHRVVKCHITAPDRPQTTPSWQAFAESSQLRSAEVTTATELDIPAEGFDSIADALDAIAAGELVVVLDDASRENEGDLIFAADKVTPEKVAFMVEHTSGVICVGLQGSDCDRLRLPLMVPSSENEESMYTAFTVTVDLRQGVTTGISASDRAKTIAALGNPNTTHEQLRKPGHIFPLRAREGGVLVRPGHTEAAIDLAYYAGCYPAGVLCEVVDRQTGEMARTEQLQAFAREHSLKCVTIEDLVRYRLKRELLLQKTRGASLATRWGDFRAVGFRSLLESQEHMALVHGDIKSGRPLVRIHEENVVGDVFGVEFCNSQPELDAAMKAIVAHGAGILIYLCRREHQHARIVSTLQHLQDLQDTCEYDDDFNPIPTRSKAAPWDVRDMGNVHSVLQGVRTSRSISLITDDASDVSHLRAFGHDVQMLPLSSLL